MKTAIREWPIVLQDWEVRAIHSGQKTQKRVVVQPQPPADKTEPLQTVGGIGWKWWGHCVHKYDDNCWPRGEIDFIFPPFGRIGDRLRGKEAFLVDPSDVEDGKFAVHYRADHPREHCTWKSAHQMPQRFCRIMLEVTGVRVERLQKISEADCWSEGIDEVDGLFSNAEIIVTAQRLGCCIEDARPTFACLWDRFNGKRKGWAWNDNPWCWVAEFKRLEVAQCKR